MPTTIELATAADCAAVIACVHAAYIGYVADIGRRPAPMDANYADLIARGLVYVLREAGDQRLYGVVVLYVEDGGLFIENVAVQPTDQHRGYGRQLMAFAEERARSLGLPHLWLYAHERMSRNITFYARLGYEEIERRTEHEFARVFMRKLLVR
jgi:ribosomal protein S18 acetylase RimI-like enzyme